MISASSSAVTRLGIKSALLAGAALWATMASSPAEARGYHHNHYYGGHGYHAGYHRSYRRGYRHGYRRGHRRNNDAAYLAGGLVLGSLLTHAYHNHQDRYVRDVRVVRERPLRQSERVSRRLFRDRHGNCFERTYTPDGDELLLELDERQCHW